MELHVRYLGVPRLRLNGREVYLPFAKAEGLLFYVLHEKTALRDKLCLMFWGAQDEANAKKNLRNAVYAIRKAAYEGIIVSPRRAVLEADATCTLHTDVDALRAFQPAAQPEDDAIDAFLALYEGDFMTGTLGGECPDYDDWVRGCAQIYRREYTGKLRELFHGLIREKRWLAAEKCGLKLIFLDEFEEIAYRSLMFVYKEQGKYAECSAVYSRLEKTLREGLSIKPSAETRRFFESTLQKQKGVKRQEALFGREQECAALRRSLTAFAGGGTACSYLVVGEAGIGKTRLLESAAAATDSDAIVIKTICYEAEASFLFKLWDRIFEQLSYFLRERAIAVPQELSAYIGRTFPTFRPGTERPDYTPHMQGEAGMADKAVFELFSYLAHAEHRVLFIIDDLHWADKNSMELLIKVLFASRERLMLVGACRAEYEGNVDRLYFSLNHSGSMEKLVLQRFTQEETRGLVSRLMPDAAAHSEKIYRESEGNPLFITEIVNSLRDGRSEDFITDKMAVLIGGRIMALSLSAQRLLSICAVFYTSFNLKILSDVMEVGGLELVELIDELITKNILREAREPEGEISLFFTHVKIREYIYASISESKRAVLHERIAEHYEKRLCGGRMDRVYYPKLIYHYTMARNTFQIFRCKVLSLRSVLDVSHEIFPRTDIRDTGVLEYYTDEEALDAELTDLQTLCTQLRERGSADGLGELELIFLLLYGRFHKDRGIPQKGHDAILQMIALSEQRGLTEYAFEGYLQLIQYAINICDLSMMEEAVNQAERLVGPSAGDAALVTRYRGYLHVLRGEYERGDELLTDALRLFCALGNYETYRMNLAACCFYLGESCRLCGRYEEALECYDKAFDHCDEELHFSAVAVILSRIGYSEYLLGHGTEARFYLLKSLQAYNKTIFAWGRADVYYSLALIELEAGHPEMARKYIEGAVLFSNKYDTSNLRETIAGFQKKLDKKS